MSKCHKSHWHILGWKSEWIHFRLIRLIKYQGPHLENALAHVADMAHPSKNLELTRNDWMEMKVQDFNLRELIKMGRETPSSSTLAPWNFVTFGNRRCWKELCHDHGVKWNKYSLHPPFWHLGSSAKSDSFPRLTKSSILSGAYNRSAHTWHRNCVSTFGQVMCHGYLHPWHRVETS